MKPILVLAPEEPGAPSLERGHVDVCRVGPTVQLATGKGVYESVIVINDGGTDTLRRVHMALELCGRGAPCAVGVLTYVADPTVGAADAVSLADWLALWRQLRTELREAVLSLEYQAD